MTPEQMRRLLDARDPGRVQARATARLELASPPAHHWSGVVHTDYWALGCGQYGRGDSISGHRPETTCPDCRANLIREGGMTEAMFYPQGQR